MANIRASHATTTAIVRQSTRRILFLDFLKTIHALFMVRALIKTRAFGLGETAPTWSTATTDTVTTRGTGRIRAGVAAWCAVGASATLGCRALTAAGIIPTAVISCADILATHLRGAAAIRSRSTQPLTG